MPIEKICIWSQKGKQKDLLVHYDVFDFFFTEITVVKSFELIMAFTSFLDIKKQIIGHRLAKLNKITRKFLPLKNILMRQIEVGFKQNYVKCNQCG